MGSSSLWTALHAQIHRTVRQRQLLLKDQRLLVAVSGGQDSLCLVRLLLDLQPKWGWKVAIAHCNHRWRSDAAANAEYVAHLAEAWQVPYHEAIAPEVPSSEAAARDWRYQVLREIALEQAYSAVVTGHTASDRAETLLYNLMRGSGADGLQALTWTRDLAPSLKLVRPLLEMTRLETAKFCQDANLKVWEDSTNQDWHYARNRIRQELFPYLRTHFNPQIEQTLAQTAELLRAEVDYLAVEANRLWQQVVASEPREQTAACSDPVPRLRLNRVLLRAAPLALQRRVIRRCLQENFPVAPHFEHVEKLLALVDAPNRSCTDPFPGGTIARVEADWILFQSASPARGQSQQ